MVEFENHKKIKLKRQPLHIEVADLVRQMIMDGTLKQGLQIRELELCEQLSVSRTPLREALKALHVEGFVEIITNRGCWVTQLTKQDCIDNFELLSALEGKAAELAVLRATDDQITELTKLHQEMDGYFRLGDKQRYFDKNQTIHLTIIHLAGNAKLSALHKQLMNLVTLGRYRAIDVECRWQESMYEHEALIEAFKARQHQRAASILSEHVMQTGITLSELKLNSKTS